MKGITLPIKIIPDDLYNLYEVEKKSVSQIADFYGCSQNKINYWIEKFEIQKRTISDAIYQLKNPLGDPFSLKEPQTMEDGILYGMGLALYWGEGVKRGNGGIRISNTDPKLIKKFIAFLEQFCSIDKNKLKFSIQIFKDISPKKAVRYWRKQLGMKKEQFYKPLVIKVRAKGSYKYKSKYGVVILYFNNIKLKQIICSMIENIP